MKYIKIILVLIVVIFLLYVFLNNVDLANVWKLLSRVNFIYPLVFLIGLFLQFFIRGYRWGILFRPYKKKISLLTLYNYTVIGFLINTIIPGRIGEPARGIMIADEESVKRSHGLATVVLERMIDFLVVLLLFFVSLSFMKGDSSPLLVQLKKGASIFLPVVLIVFASFFLINTGKISALFERFIRFLSKLIPMKFREKVVDFLINFMGALKLNLGFVDYIKLSLSSALVWIFLIPFYWFLMQGFPFGSSLSLFEIIPYFSIIVFAAAIPTPAMAGSFDLASKKGLLELYKNNKGSIITGDDAIAYTLLVHVLILVVIIIPGVIALLSKGINLKNIKKIKEKKDEMS
ncbi:MAG: lysylphosphatidylglycerol synthase transmembrane domain-containing protein [Acidobacteriota bacterium]